MTDPLPDSPVTTAPAGTSPTHRSDARQLLRGHARDVLERISTGDPLEMRGRVQAELRQRCLLFDEERALIRAWARCARYAGRLRPHQRVERWLERQVSAALDDLIVESEWHGVGLPSSNLAASFGLSEIELARACAQFNRLPFTVRRAFFRVVLDARPLESLVYSGGPSAVAIARDARRALLVFLAPKPTPLEAWELSDE